MKLTPRAQEQPHTCAVACLRIVAEYYGLIHSEAELVPLCQTTLDGTTPEALAEAARQLGLTARLTFDDPAILNIAISQQQPVIVYLGIPTASLELGIHAVVVSDTDHERHVDRPDRREGTFLSQKQLLGSLAKCLSNGNPHHTVRIFLFPYNQFINYFDSFCKSFGSRS